MVDEVLDGRKCSALVIQVSFDAGAELVELLHDDFSHLWKCPWQCFLVAKFGASSKRSFLISLHFPLLTKYLRKKIQISNEKRVGVASVLFLELAN